MPVDVKADTGAFECSEGYCILQRPDGLRIAQAEDRDILGAACADADLIVAAFPVPRRGCGDGGAKLISARELARRGAAEVFIPRNTGAGKAAIEVSFAFANLDRPWRLLEEYGAALRVVCSALWGSAYIAVGTLQGPALRREAETGISLRPLTPQDAASRRAPR